MTTTPRPWKVHRLEPGPRGAHGGYSIEDANRMPFLLLGDGALNKERAELIVRAVNTFDETQQALTQALEWIPPKHALLIKQIKAALAHMEGT